MNDFQLDDLLLPYFSTGLHFLLSCVRYRKNRQLPDILLVPSILWAFEWDRDRRQKSGRQLFP